MKYYAGIGSRDVSLLSDDIKDLMMKVSTYLANNQYTLRSGAADGCDSIFEMGCNKGNGNKEIYLPWKNFNGSQSEYYTVDENALYIASKYHPAWANLSNPVKKLQARNVYQILGFNLNSPVAFILCFTKNGLDIGGTGQAIRIAKANNIPIFNFGKYKDYDICRIELWEFLQNIDKNLQ